MTKETQAKLNRSLEYKQRLLNRLDAPVTLKHQNRVVTYKNYLMNELRIVTANILKLKDGT